MWETRVNNKYMRNVVIIHDKRDQILKVVTDTPKKKVNIFTIYSQPIALLCPQSNGEEIRVEKLLVQMELTSIASSIHKDL